MRAKLRLAALLAAVIALAACQGNGYREVQQYTVEQFMNTTSIFGSSFSFDESSILFSSNESGIYNAYTIPVEGGEPTQITASEDNAVFTYSFFPGDDRMLYRSDQGGNEFWHVYLREEDGSVHDLTPGESARSLFAGWAYDEESLFFSSNERNPMFMDIYEMDIETFTPEMIYQNDAGYDLGDISNDKCWMAFHKTITTNNSDMYLYDRETDELKHLTPHEGDINYFPATFSADSRSLYYTTDEGSEFSYLMRYDMETGESEKVLEADWDVQFAYLSYNGTYMVVGINNDARTEISIYDQDTGRKIRLPRLPDGEITSVRISKSEKLMTFYHNGSRSPNNLYVYSFDTRRYTKLTDTMNPEIDKADLVEAKVVRYESFDGLEIPTIHYKPQHIKPGEKAPALVSVHGGPGGQSRTGYNPLIQYLVNHGYVVTAVNNRGSSGYGKTFYKLDDLKHGNEDLDDCVEAKKYLTATGYVDEEQIGIIGGSYGGYMVLAALAFRPEAFNVGVDLFGISNWYRTLSSIPAWWEAFREALYKELGNPETQEQFLRDKSPLFHADRIVRPLMVLQGANDPRVLKVESDDIVAAVRERGVPVEYLVFDDEGHGFVKKENQLEGWEAILRFLDQHLKGEPPAEEPPPAG